jgi:glycosyltransferase involved in cell wall biosynthesis
MKVPQAGQRNAFKNLIQYKDRFNIFLLSFVNELEMQSLKEEDYSFCEQVFFFPVTKWSRIKGILLHPRLPTDVAVRIDRKMEDKLKKIIQDRTFTAAHMEYTAAANYVNLLQGIPRKALFERDVTFQRIDRKATISKGFLKVFYQFEAKRQKEWEIEILRQFDEILVPSQKDKELLLSEGLDEDKIIVRISKIDDRYRHISRSKVQRNSLLFWGAMDRNENIDGALWFLQDIFPAVKARFSDSKVYIVGANPPKKLLNRQSESVIITGFVDDPEKYFELAQISVVPLRMGAGLKVKVLEALSAGLLVIATQVGAEGIQDEKLLVAQDEKHFIELILKCFTK